MIGIDPIEQECRTLTRYLIGRYPEPYVVEKYVEAHLITTEYSDRNRFDGALTKIARTHPVLAKLADSHARLFAPRGLLRKKLVLLLAILETCAPSYQLLDQTDSVSRPLVLLRLVGRGVGSALSLALGSLLLLPLQLILGIGRTSG